MVRLSLLLVAVLVLAGCTQTPASEPQPTSDIRKADEAASQVPVKATPTTGVIRGVVVDAAIRPVSGVAIVLEGTSKMQTTGEQGTFGFDDLPAGTHFLSATRPKYESMRLGVVVEAGVQNPEPVRIVMLAIPGLEPFIEAFQASLFVAFSAPAFGSLSPSDAGLEGDDRATFVMAPNATVIQAEVTWEPTTPTGAHIRMYASATEQGSPMEIKSMSGGSPLFLLLNGTADGDIADGFYFGVGSLSRALTSTAPPDPEGYLVVNQEFQGFAHAFHNFMPDEGWLFVRDGPHPIPPP